MALSLLKAISSALSMMSIFHECLGRPSVYVSGSLLTALPLQHDIHGRRKSFVKLNQSQLAQCARVQECFYCTGPSELHSVWVHAVAQREAGRQVVHKGPLLGVLLHGLQHLLVHLLLDLAVLLAHHSLLGLRVKDLALILATSPLD